MFLRGVFMKNVYLIACSKRKQNYPCAAEEMYLPSNLYSASLAYALERVVEKENQIHILSTKHGLLGLSDIIDPYEKEKIGNTKNEVIIWGMEVFRRLQEIHDIGNTNFIFLAGANYVNSFSSYLFHFETPLSGMQLGPRTSWLQRHQIPRTTSKLKSQDKTIENNNMNLDIKIGQTLWATNGEPVIVSYVDDNEICVRYKEQKILRDKEIVNNRLFLTKDEAILSRITAQGECDTLESAQKESLEQQSTDKVISVTLNRLQGDSCDNCMLMRREDCFGDTKICEYYQHVPNVTKEEIDKWPKEYMGAYERNYKNWKK